MSDASVPLFEARGLKVHFPVRRSSAIVRAVDGVDLEWRRGEVLGIVGESGCGKSTLGRALLALQESTDGEVLFEGKPLGQARRGDLRKRVQMIFQDPYQSLNPRMPVGAQVREGLRVHGIGSRTEQVERGVRALEEAGLAPAERYWDRLPHELSGGQRQRVVIASAMALDPVALLCDEPVSALDVSVRAQVLHLLSRLRDEHGLSLVFITHDVGLAWTFCDRVAVMYLGRIVEQGTTEEVLGNPQHPYTQALLSVVPTTNPRTERRALLEGDLPDASRVPEGCRFHPRCPRAQERCTTDEPDLMPSGGETQLAACWYAGALAPEPVA